jgi:ankyrin repeat protein
MRATEVLQRYLNDTLEFDEINLTDVNQRGHFGNTPLHIASSRGNLEEIEALLAAGADVDARGEDGDTPLFRAAQQSHVPVVKRLLGAGASPDSPNNYGRTPRQVAVSLNHQEVVTAIDDWEKAKI